MIVSDGNTLVGTGGFPVWKWAGWAVIGTVATALLVAKLYYPGL